MIGHTIRKTIFVIVVVVLAGISFSIAEQTHPSLPGYQAFNSGDASADNASLLAFNAFNFRTNDSLSCGGNLYLYAAATDGGHGISGENFTPDLNLTDSAGSSSVVVIGHSLSNSTSYSTSATCYTVAEAKVRGGITESYTFRNNASGASVLNGNFPVQSNGSLVVIMVAGTSVKKYDQIKY